MNNLKANLQKICSRVELACNKAGRNPAEVFILAVSKGHPAARIGELYDFGQRAFGENYVQEALAKQEQLQALDIEWHFLGPLQSNKTREVAHHFDWVQSADRKKILKRLSEQRPAGLPELNVCIQVNIDREVQKSGVMSEDLEEMARYAANMKNLRLRGLMAIPRQSGGGHTTADSYRRLRRLFDGLVARGIPLDTLSMGMSADFETAISEGSTLVRIGTDLFGPRI